MQLLQQDLEYLGVVCAPSGVSIVERRESVSDHAAGPKRQAPTQGIFYLLLIFLVLICEELRNADQSSNPK